MKICFKSLAGVIVCGLLACAQPQPESQAQPAKSPSGKSANRMTADHTFVTKAAQGGLAEVQLGKLAQEKAASADVKTFGELMVNDHSKANDELQKVAAGKGITLPNTTDAKQQATYDRLSKLSGAEFDRAYMKDMVADHRTDVNEFKKESQSGTDPEIKEFAAKTLPTLQHHLEVAQSTDAKVKK